MIVGIGTDLTEISRVLKACEKQGFCRRIFTRREQELIAARPRAAAGNFAVKEAAAKVFGTGFRGFAPVEIEVLRDELGAPYIRLYGHALEMAQKAGISRWHVSISNTDTHVSAVVIGEN